MSKKSPLGGPPVSISRVRDFADIRTFADQYVQQVPTRDDMIVEVYGFPITVDGPEPQDGRYRIAAWNRGEQRRTKPLCEEIFSYDEYHRLCRDVAMKSNYRDLPPGAGLTENFMVEWTRINLRTIEEAAYRRSRNSFTFDTGAGPDGVGIPTRSFRGEDGLMYEELDLRGEDTDPVLLDATMNRDRVLQAALEAERREQAEAEERRQEGLRRLKELQEKREREQAEFEAMPGYGSF